MLIRLIVLNVEAIHSYKLSNREMKHIVYQDVQNMVLLVTIKHGSARIAQLAVGNAIPKTNANNVVNSLH